MKIALIFFYTGSNFTESPEMHVICIRVDYEQIYHQYTVIEM